MADTAAGILVDTIHDWGVDIVFGFPGDGINGIMEALRKRQDRLRFLQVRHEEAAAFMACGFARYTGKLGACLATSGPGGIHLVSGLYDAKIDGLPVVAMTGHHYHDVIGTHTQQDVDLTKLFEDVALYSERVMGPAHAENVAHVACRTALGFGGVAHINVPTDIQDQTTERRSKENVPHHQSAALGPSTLVPPETELRRAADTLDAGQRIALLIGEDAQQARAEIARLSDTLAAPAVGEQLGRLANGGADAFSAGCLGLLGTQAAQQAIGQCDTLFLIGARFPYSESSPVPQGTRVVQLARDPSRLGLRYAVEVGLVGDTGATLRALLPMLRRKSDRGFLDLVKQAQGERQAGQEQGPDGLVMPQALAQELSRRLSANCILISDPSPLAQPGAGQAQGEAQDGQRPERDVVPSTLPYANAAQVAFPDTQCVALVGDHSFPMLMGEFITAVKYKLPVRVVLLQDPDGPTSGVDFAAYAEACGGAGFAIRSAAECGTVLDRALRAGGPVLIQARTAAQA